MSRKIPAFTYESYMKQKLTRLQGNDKIPDDVIEKVKEQLEEFKVINPTQREIKQILKKLNLIKYIDQTPSILNHFNKDKELDKVTLKEEIECPVCFDNVKEVIKLECKHLFCESCINRIKKDNIVKCPLCRNMQESFLIFRLNEEDKKIILEEFIKNQDKYRVGKSMMSFDKIMFKIAKEKGINI